MNESKVALQAQKRITVLPHPSTIWSKRLLARNGPIARLIKMGREARKLAKKGMAFERQGNLDAAIFKFQFAASKEKNASFAADLHEMAAGTMLNTASYKINPWKKNQAFMAAAEEYCHSANKRSTLDPERAARVYMRAAELFSEAGDAQTAKRAYKEAFDLTSNPQLREAIKAEVRLLN